MIILGTLGPAAAQDWSQRCSGIAEAHLIDHGVDPTDILDSVVIERLQPLGATTKTRERLTQREAVNEALIAGFTVRVRLESCGGSILYRMGRRCQIRDLESRGDCPIPPSADPWPEDG